MPDIIVLLDCTFGAIPPNESTVQTEFPNPPITSAIRSRCLSQNKVFREPCALQPSRSAGGPLEKLQIARVWRCSGLEAAPPVGRNSHRVRMPPV